jgi:hypothetical protein
VSSPPVPARPQPLTAVTVLVALQGLGLAAAAAFLLVEIVVANPASIARASLSAALALLAGLGLLGVARGLGAARRWSRSPALVTQLLVLPVGVGLVQGDRWYVGVPLVVWALGVVVLLFSRPVSEVLSD